MNETEREILHVKTRISKLAVASFVIGILGLIIVFLRAAYYRPWWSEYIARNVTFLLGIIGLLLGFAALVRISRRLAAITIPVILILILLQPFFAYVPRSGKFSFFHSLANSISFTGLLVLVIMPVIPKWYAILKNQRRNGTFANSGIVISTLLILFWWTETCGPHQLALRMACGSNLAHLGKALTIYSVDNPEHYPESDQWCNSLMQYEQVKKSDFLCAAIKYSWKRQVFPWPVPKNKECYYAMNPFCEPDSPPDTVLLFETNGGWNLSGGPEILTTENHGGEGCNILFNGGYVQFIGKKHLADLNWKPE